MTHRFSPLELYTLRNAIPIDSLIKALPALAPRKSDSHPPFLCPLCSGSHTATNPKTNLARCFSCNRNFNTIDLVMLVKKMNFKDAVNALSSRYNQLIAPTPGRTSLPPHDRLDSTGSFSSLRDVLVSALARLSPPR